MVGTSSYSSSADGSPRRPSPSKPLSHAKIAGQPTNLANHDDELQAQTAVAIARTDERNESANQNVGDDGSDSRDSNHDEGLHRKRTHENVGSSRGVGTSTTENNTPNKNKRARKLYHPRASSDDEEKKEEDDESNKFNTGSDDLSDVNDVEKTITALSLPSSNGGLGESGKRRLYLFLHCFYCVIGFIIIVFLMHIYYFSTCH